MIQDSTNDSPKDLVRIIDNYFGWLCVITYYYPFGPNKRHLRRSADLRAPAAPAAPAPAAPSAPAVVVGDHKVIFWHHRRGTNCRRFIITTLLLVIICLPRLIKSALTLIFEVIVLSFPYISFTFPLLSFSFPLLAFTCLYFPFSFPLLAFALLSLLFPLLSFHVDFICRFVSLFSLYFRTGRGETKQEKNARNSQTEVGVLYLEALTKCVLKSWHTLTAGALKILG